MVVVAGRDDQCTKGNERVRGKYTGFVMNGARNRVLSSNVMTN